MAGFASLDYYCKAGCQAFRAPEAHPGLATCWKTNGCLHRETRVGANSRATGAGTVIAKAGWRAASEPKGINSLVRTAGHRSRRNCRT